MKTYIIWDNDEGHFFDGFFGTLDIEGAIHYSSLKDAEDAQPRGDDCVILEWK